MKDHQAIFALQSNILYEPSVCLLDSMEGTFKWLGSGTGANFAVTQDTTYPYSGSNCLKMVSRTTGPSEDDQVTAQRSFTRANTGLLMVRARVLIGSTSLTKMIGMSLTVREGAYIYTGTLHYYPSAKTVYVLDAAGSEVEVADAFPYNVGDTNWLMMELRIDYKKGQYKDVILGGIDTAISNQDMPKVVIGTYYNTTVSLFATAAGAVPCTAYWDTVYVGEYLNL